MERSQYSARVTLRLVVDGEEIPLASVGLQTCTAQVALRDMPASDACLVIDVDGDVAKYFVRLEDGTKAGSKEIIFSARPFIPIEYAATLRDESEMRAAGSAPAGFKPSGCA
jgi:hypothetical protein